MVQPIVAAWVLTLAMAGGAAAQSSISRNIRGHEFVVGAQTGDYDIPRRYGAVVCAHRGGSR